MIIALRPSTPQDTDYCFHLHKAAMGDYVANLWGWDDTVQRAFHDRQFTPGEWQIITADGTDVGMLHTEHRANEIYLARIEIHPTHQGRGIGTHLIRRLLQEAQEQGLPLTLDVLTINQGAQSLYHRLGLHEISRPNGDPTRQK